MPNLKPADKEILSEIGSKFQDLEELYGRLSQSTKISLNLFHMHSNSLPNCIHTGKKSSREIMRAFRIRLIQHQSTRKEKQYEHEIG